VGYEQSVWFRHRAILPYHYACSGQEPAIEIALVEAIAFK